MSVAKVPCTIVTGFLGAGKTTLVRHVLENAGGRRLAVIVNEFGDVGIDGEILKSCGVESCPEDAIVELANGCLCCTVADDFVPALKSLLDRPSPPEHIVIETSGLALPKPLVKAFNWPEIASRVTVDGVIAVVDGAAVAAGRFADDPEAVARQRAEDFLARPRQSAGGGVRGPAPLCRPGDHEQGRPDVERAASQRRRRDRQDAVARGQGRGDRERQGRAESAARPRRRGRSRPRQPALAPRSRRRARSRGFRHVHRRAAGLRIAAAPGRPPGEGGRNARHPAHEGLCRHCRQADAPARAGRRRASPAPVRSQMARRAPRPAGGDRREGLRQGCDSELIRG